MKFFKYWVITLSLLAALSASVDRVWAQMAKTDSVVVFQFKVGKEMFWLDYKDNKTELSRLAQFLHGNRAKIMRGQKKIFIDGYCNTMSTFKENINLVKVRSNHVKSYMVLMYGFKDEFFKTVNHVDSSLNKSDIVEVSFTMPVYKMDTVKRVPSKPIHVTAQLIKDTIVRYTDTAKIAYLHKQMPVYKHSFEAPFNYALLKKGTYFTSLFANFTDARTANMLVEPLFDISQVYSRNVTLQASFGYFTDNNVAIGAYGEYSMADTRVEVSSDILQLLINSKTYQTNNVSTGFKVGFFTKNFVPLDFKHRVFLVNETSIFYGYNRSLSRNVYDRGAMLSKVYQNTHSIGVKLSMGIQYFLCPGLTMEFNISPVAAMYQYNSVVNNETLNGKFAGGGINTILLPIDLKFGLTYYFGLDYNKNRKHVNNYMKSGVLTRNKKI